MWLYLFPILNHQFKCRILCIFAVFLVAMRMILFLFQYLKVHLEFLQFLLKEGDIYLAWPRCKDIWDTLVANPKASGYDKEVRISYFLFSSIDDCYK